MSLLLKLLPLMLLGVILIYLISLFLFKRDDSNGISVKRKAQIMIISSVLLLSTYFLPWLEVATINTITKNAFATKDINIQLIIYVYGNLIGSVIILLSGIIQLIRPLKKNGYFIILESVILLIPVLFSVFFYSYIPIIIEKSNHLSLIAPSISIAYGFVLNALVLLLTLILLLFLNYEKNRK